MRDLRRAGVRAPAVLGQAAFLTGLLDAPRDLHPGDLAGLLAMRLERR